LLHTKQREQLTLENCWSRALFKADALPVIQPPHSKHQSVHIWSDCEFLPKPEHDIHIKDKLVRYVGHFIRHYLRDDVGVGVDC